MVDELAYGADERLHEAFGDRSRGKQFNVHCLDSGFVFGARYRLRTCDPLHVKQVLYP